MGPDETNIRNRHCNSPTIENIKQKESGRKSKGGAERKKEKKKKKEMYTPYVAGNRTRRTPVETGKGKDKPPSLIISPTGIIPKTFTEYIHMENKYT